MKKFLIAGLLLICGICFAFEMKLNPPLKLSNGYFIGSKFQQNKKHQIISTQNSLPTDGLVDVWFWKDYDSSTNWRGSINGTSYLSGTPRTINVASGGIENIGINNNTILNVDLQNITIFAILYKRKVTNTIGFAGSTVPIDHSANLSDTSFDWYENPPRAGYRISVSGWSDFTEKWIEFELNLPASGNSYAIIDGVRKNGVSTTNATGVANIGLLADSTGNRFRGFIKAFAIYSTTLSTDTRTLVWNYLRENKDN